MTHELSREEMLEKAEELENLAREINGKFDEAQRLRERRSSWQRFASRNRADFARVPSWLWIPMVSFLVALFVLALLIAGGHLAA
ncbi:MAG: hypothetical protein ACREXV_17555 [Polaromonas sp.]